MITRTAVITLRTELGTYGIAALAPGSTVHVDIQTDSGLWSGQAEITAVSVHEMHHLPETKV